MYKKIFILIQFLFLIVFLTGCYNYNEIQNYALVTGFAIDKGEEYRFKVTAEIVAIKGGKDAQVTPQVIYEEGDTVFEAVRKMTAIFGKKVYAGHAKVIIISEELAKECVCEIIDFFMRDSEIRSVVSLYITKGKEAKEMLDNTSLFLEIASYEIERVGFNDDESLGYGRRVQLYQAANTVLSQGTQLSLPVLDIVKIDEKKTTSIYGLGLFKDNKLIDIIEGDKVKYFKSFLNEFSGGTVSIPLENGAYIGYELTGGKSKTKVKFKNNRYEFTINFKVNYYLESISDDRNGNSVSFKDYNTSKILEEYWKKNMFEIFEHVKSLNTDVLSFGRQIMGRNFKEWEKIHNQDNLLDKIDLKINIELTNYGSGKGKEE